MILAFGSCHVKCFFLLIDTLEAVVLRWEPQQVDLWE